MPVTYDNKGRIIRPYEQHNWTKEMVLEYAKCAKSVKYFMLHHCKVMHPTRGVIQPDLRDYQMRMLKLLDGNDKTVLNCPRQIGKCLDSEVKIKVKNKQSGEIQELTFEEFYKKL